MKYVALEKGIYIAPNRAQEVSDIVFVGEDTRLHKFTNSQEILTLETLQLATQRYPTQ